FTVGPDNVQFSAIIFSDFASLLFRFSDYTSVDDISKALLNASYQNGMTNTAAALRLARKVAFSEASGARQNVGKVCILLTDGLSNNPDLLEPLDISVIAVGVGPGADQRELHDIASPPSQVFEVDNFNVLGAIRNALVTTACNRESCITLIDLQCNGVADILLILDSSGTFVAQLTTNFTVGPRHVQFGLIIFSSSAFIEFNFTRYTSTDDLYQAIIGAPYLGGGTDTAGGLRLARLVSFTPEAGARHGVGKAAIVVTDGVSNNAQETAEESSLLKNIGVTVMSVGVGQYVDRTELLTIASAPNLVFEVDNFNVLDAISKSLLTSACNSLTNTDAALKLARQVAFTAANGARPGAKKAAIVLTDGASNNSIEAGLFKQSGVKVLGIGIGTYFAIDELLVIASSPNLVYNVSGYDVLTSIVREVAITTCQSN
ncbi:unnamed protein product, partial [Candidula unifasciata]